MALVYLRITLNQLILTSHAKVSTAEGKCFPVTLGSLLPLVSDVLLHLLPSRQWYQLLGGHQTQVLFGNEVLASTGADMVQAAACSPSSSSVVCCNLDLEVTARVEGGDIIAGTCPCSPVDLAKQHLAERLSLSLFTVKHRHGPFGQLLLRATDGRRWSRAQAVSLL